MKNLKVFTGWVSAVSMLAACVGFLIVFQVAPQAAIARFCVDLGALLALVAIVVAVPKTQELRSDEVTDALRDLARGKYERRLASKENDPLSGVIQAFNELAGTLSDNADPGIHRLKSFRSLRYEPVVARQMVHEAHSFHPELGQVQPLPRAFEGRNLRALYEEFREAHKKFGNEPSDFETFAETLDRAREELMKQHQVKSVRFEVVLESGEVALRPRLVR
ncbi:MAG: hypothetical protein I8H75_03315 [Myxococcaceae bacterium]|nr:hypothetical protein [Myxococcaceae bacterium]MBH2006359.1 hypothetical protein [Myxococcaceae bacterium]